MRTTTIGNLFLALLFWGSLRAQMANTGEMSVLPGTTLSTYLDFDNTSTATFTNDGEFHVFRNFNNDGIIGFTSGQRGYTLFEGNRLQSISGNAPSDYFKFYDVLFNNSSPQPPFKLSGTISISGNSDLLNGIVKGEGDGLAVYENKATHSNTDNDSHIDGYVQKNGDEEFRFPIGNGGYHRPAKIAPTSPNAPTDAFMGKYFLENSNTLYPHASKAGNIEVIDNTEYWTIDKLDGETEIMLSLTWDELTTPEFIWRGLEGSGVEEEKVTIVRWNEEQNLWVDEGGIVDRGNRGTGTVTSFFTTSGFGVFTLAKVKRRVEPEGNIVIYNGVTPNGDGKNDYFFIDGITHYPNNRVSIYNRWGVKVFETTNYDSDGNVFNGISHGRATIQPDSKLPSGTYFYVLTYEFSSPSGNKRNIEKAGYLYLNDN